MKSFIRKINRRVFSYKRENEILTYFADYDKQMLFSIINFKFASYISENILQIKNTYFSNNILVFEKNKFYQTNYKDMKPVLDKNCPWKLIKKIRKSTKFLLFDFHYQYIIEIEQGCLPGWINTIIEPANNQLEGIYYQQLLKVSKKNSHLKQVTEGLMYDLNHEIGENIQLAKEIRQKPSAPPMF